MHGVVPGEARESSDGLAPVIPLFGDRDSIDDEPGQGPDPSWNSTWGDDVDADDDERDDEDDVSIGMRRAFDRLIRRLRGRGLSIAEATDSLTADGVDRAVAEVFVAELEQRRWLSDPDLAEQLVHVAVTRRGEGRRAIAQTLAKRRIPREVADAALAALPDDDADRALDYARSKAKGMAGLDRDTAVRRLVGQLSRRGYPGTVAMTAARTALDESASASSGVRFR